MRRVLLGDVTAAARALLAVPPAGRPALVATLFAEADAAEAHRRDTGRAHPSWGTGSLMAAALTRPLEPEPCLDDPEYAACLAQLFAALAARAG